VAAFREVDFPGGQGTGGGRQPQPNRTQRIQGQPLQLRRLRETHPAPQQTQYPPPHPENTLTLKSKDNSVEPTKRKREGLEVTSRRNNSSKKDEEEEDVRVVNLGGVRKTTNSSSNSNKNLKLISSSRDKAQRVSNPKRSEESLEKEEQRARIQNKELVNTLMQQQFAPNYINKLKIKKMEQKEQKEMKELKEMKEKEKSKAIRKKFLNCEQELKSEEEMKYYQVYEELGKGAYGVVKMGICKRTN
jgi:hypothetical protein